MTIALAHGVMTDARDTDTRMAEARTPRGVGAILHHHGAAFQLDPETEKVVEVGVPSTLPIIAGNKDKPKKEDEKPPGDHKPAPKDPKPKEYEKDPWEE